MNTNRRNFGRLWIFVLALGAPLAIGLTTVANAQDRDGNSVKPETQPRSSAVCLTKPGVLLGAFSFGPASTKLH